MNDVEIQRKIDVILTLLSERKLNNIPKLEDEVIEYLSELNRIFDDDSFTDKKMKYEHILEHIETKYKTKLCRDIQLYLTNLQRKNNREMLNRIDEEVQEDFRNIKFILTAQDC